jgi:hypothetical protein
MGREGFVFGAYCFVVHDLGFADIVFQRCRFAVALEEAFVVNAPVVELGTLVDI